jgi:hypothetical protein
LGVGVPHVAPRLGIDYPRASPSGHSRDCDAGRYCRRRYATQKELDHFNIPIS